MNRMLPVIASVLLAAMGSPAALAQESDAMGFFITSENGGNGADLGGIEGADQHCQRLAEAAGAGNRTWRAYLSAGAADGSAAVNARDRIGDGPWYNAKKVLIASNLDELHGDANKINKETGLTEKGEPVNGRGDSPNMHDILTGSQADGTAFSGDADKTCGNWTKSGDGSAQVGHHDRIGLRDDAPSKSWNSSHGSRGCGIDQLRGSGGNGFFYCFAAD